MLALMKLIALVLALRAERICTDTIPDDPAEYNVKGADKLNNNGKLAYVYGMRASATAVCSWPTS